MTGGRCVRRRSCSTRSPVRSPTVRRPASGVAARGCSAGRSWGPLRSLALSGSAPCSVLAAAVGLLSGRRQRVLRGHHGDDPRPGAGGAARRRFRARSGSRRPSASCSVSPSCRSWSPASTPALVGPGAARVRPRPAVRAEAARLPCSTRELRPVVPAGRVAQGLLGVAAAATRTSRGRGSPGSSCRSATRWRRSTCCSASRTRCATRQDPEQGQTSSSRLYAVGTIAHGGHRSAACRTGPASRKVYVIVSTVVMAVRRHPAARVLPDLPGRMVAALHPRGSATASTSPSTRRSSRRSCPRAIDRGRDLGVINIANSAPQVLGPVIAAPIVTALGYPGLYVLTAVITLLSAVLVTRIRSVP